MKKNFAVITMLLFSIDQYSCSQTLPTVQSTNVRSPTDLKVDGKSTEWGDKYQAYNKSTDIFYTISNDDINLYLIVHATNPRIIQKIIYVGLTLTINSNGKNNIKDPENTGVTYPLLNTRDGALIIYNARDVAYNPGTHLIKDDSTLRVASTKQIDSTIKIANSLLVSNAKEIKINGINHIQDSLISIYNEDGIHVASEFDIRGSYTYEVSIPLKYLNVLMNDRRELSYNIQIKGRNEVPKKGMLTHYYYRDGHPIDADADLDTTTDFWGRYMLSKP